MFGFGPAFAGLIHSDTNETYQISNREVEKAQFLARKRQDELDEIRVENDGIMGRANESGDNNR